MKNYIERTLEQIQEIGASKGLVLSCDIYYDNLRVDRGEQFVVRISDAKRVRHFRTNHIRKSLKAALEFVKGL